MALQVHSTPFVISPPDDLLTAHPQLRHMSQNIAQRYADTKLVTDEQLALLGGALWKALEIDARFTRARDEAGMGVLPIVVESDDAAVQQLPWETLHHPALSFLGKRPEFTLCRGCSSRPPSAPIDKGPL